MCKFFICEEHINGELFLSIVRNVALMKIHGIDPRGVFIKGGMYFLDFRSYLLEIPLRVFFFFFFFLIIPNKEFYVNRL